MWTFLVSVCSQISDPLLIGGDLNTILCPGDRLNGNEVTLSKMADLTYCLQVNNLSEVKSVGDYYTWCNNQDGADKIHSKLDRCVANIPWLTQFYEISVEIMEKNVSDHAPLMLDFLQTSVRRITPFRFLNIIIDHADFYDILQSVWQQDIYQ